MVSGSVTVISAMRGAQSETRHAPHNAPCSAGARLGGRSTKVLEVLNGVRRRDIEWRRKPLDSDGLRGKRMALVGGTNGLGRALARKFAAHGAKVIVVGRTFRDQGLERVSFISADL